MQTSTRRIVQKTIQSLILVAACQSVSGKAETPPADSVQIRGLWTAGRGCRASSATGSLDASASTLTLLTTDMVVQVGPGTPIGSGRVNCSIELDLSVPPGWSYAVSEFESFGYYAEVPRPTFASLAVKSYFQGHSASPTLLARESLPGSADVRFADQLAPTSLVFSPCFPRTLHLTEQLSLSGYGALRGAFWDEDVGLKLKLVWKRCN